MVTKKNGNIGKRTLEKQSERRQSLWERGEKGNIGNQRMRISPWED